MKIAWRAPATSSHERVDLLVHRRLRQVAPEQLEVRVVCRRHRLRREDEADVRLQEETGLREVRRTSPHTEWRASAEVEDELVVADVRDARAQLHRGRRQRERRDVERVLVGLAVAGSRVVDEPDRDSTRLRRRERRDDALVLELVDRDLELVTCRGRTDEREQCFLEPAREPAVRGAVGHLVGRNVAEAQAVRP
jgi:hypothetical protein